MEWIVVGCVACGIAAALLLIDDWRRTIDFRVGDVFPLFLFSTLGPVSLFAAILVWLVGVDLPNSNKVLIARKDRK